MAYKDKDKQREANRERQRRYKARSKALAKGVTSEGVTKGVTVTGEEVVIPEGVVEFDNVEALLDDLHDTKPKRGKDIKVFADLPSEVRRIIEVMSTTDGKLDKTIKANRTAIAINYQHQFPDRYHSTGVV